jgi:hypothetical protein
MEEEVPDLAEERASFSPWTNHVANGEQDRDPQAAVSHGRWPYLQPKIHL